MSLRNRALLLSSLQTVPLRSNETSVKRFVDLLDQEFAAISPTNPPTTLREAIQLYKTLVPFETPGSPAATPTNEREAIAILTALASEKPTNFRELVSAMQANGLCA